MATYDGFATGCVRVGDASISIFWSILIFYWLVLIAVLSIHSSFLFSYVAYIHSHIVFSYYGDAFGGLHYLATPGRPYHK